MLADQWDERYSHTERLQILPLKTDGWCLKIFTSLFKFPWLSVWDDWTPRCRSLEVFQSLIIFEHLLFLLVLDFFLERIFFFFLPHTSEHSGGIRNRVIDGIPSCTPLEQDPSSVFDWIFCSECVFFIFWEIYFPFFFAADLFNISLSKGLKE